jgi:mono/diheme cytochrome c family protein
MRLVVAAALAACQACGAGDPTGGATDGPTIFATACARCHGPTGKPDATLVARINVRDLTSRELRLRVTPALVENQVRYGSPNHLMPPFEGSLTEQQIKTLAAYVASDAFISSATSGSASK